MGGWLANIGSMFVLLAAAVRAVDNNDFLFLRSKSLNTIPQNQIIEKERYTVLDVIKGEKFIDYGLDIRRTNLTSFLDSMASFELNSSTIISIDSFFAGKFEKVRLTSILTEHTFFIANLFMDAKEPLFKLHLLEDPVFKELGCRHDSCRFFGQSHTGFGITEGIVLQISQINNSSGNRSVENRLCFLHIRYSDTILVVEKKPEIIEIAQMPVIAGKVNCPYPAIKIFNSSKGSTDELQLKAIRYCPMNGTHTPELFNCLQSLVFTVKSTISIEYGTPVCSYSLLANSTSHARNFAVIEIVPNTGTIVIVNRDRIVWATVARYEESIGHESEPLVLKSLYTTEIQTVFCNNINAFELCCTIVKTGAGMKIESYQILDIVTFEGMLVLVKVNLSPYSVNYTIIQSLHTKNFVIFKYLEFTTLCPRSWSGQVLIESNTPCIKLHLDTDQTVMGMSPLLYEENHSNPIDGYIVVVLAPPPSKSSLTNFLTIRPVLITGAYYTFSVDLDVQPYVCHRYFEHCGQTSLGFRDPANSNINYTVPVYVVDEYFDSILMRSEKRQLDSLSNNGKLSFYLSDYFYGDVQKVHVSRPSDQLGSSQYVAAKASATSSFFAKVSRPFKYRFWGFIQDPVIYSAVTAKKLEWSTFRFNADMTFSLALGYSANQVFFGDSTSRRYLPIYFLLNGLEFVRENRTYERTSNNQINWSAYSPEDKVRRLYCLPIATSDSSRTLVVEVTQSNNAMELNTAELNAYQLGVDSKDSPLSSFTIHLAPNEVVLHLRTPLDVDRDMAAVITNKTVYILRIDINNNLRIEILMEITLDCFLMETISNISAIRDILIVENTLLLDMNTTLLVASENVTQTRIYLFNLDIHQKLFYCYGFILIDPYVNFNEYQLYFSKATDKAVLIYSGFNRTLVEYSLDNLFLDPSNLGRQLSPDTSSFITEYGGQKISRFVPYSQASTEQMSRTLGLTFRNHYMVVMVPDTPSDADNNTKLTVLLAEIGENPLGIFKSQDIWVPSNFFISIPDIAASTRDLETVPLIVMSGRDAQWVDVYFLWLRDFVEINYQHLIAEGENVTGPIDLELKFEDPSGSKYQEMFRLRRDPRFNILSDTSELVFNKEMKMHLNVEKFGLVSSIGLECSKEKSESISGVTRNRTRNLQCKEDNYSMSLQLAMSKDCSLVPSVNKQRFPKDLVEIYSPEANHLKNLLIFLDHESLTIFQSESLNMKILMRFTSNNELIKNMILIRGARFREDHLEILALSKMGNDINEVRFKVSKKVIETVIELNQTLDNQPLDFSTNYSLSENFKRSIMQRKTNVKTIGDMVFVRTEANLFSIGRKVLVELYVQDDEPKFHEGRMVLVNSTLSNKYNEADVLAFEVLKHEVRDYPDDKNTYYKLVQLTVDHVKRKAQITRGLVTKSSDTQVDYRMGSEIDLSSIKEIDNKRILDAHVVAGQNKVTQKSSGLLIEQVYHIFIACEEYLYEIILKETSSPDSVKLTYNPVNISDVRKYNYAGLCESSSSFRIHFKARHILLHCIPRTENGVQSMALYKWLNESSQPQVVNPLHVINETSGYTEANSFELILNDSKDQVKVFKSSPRSLIEQYSVFESARLIYSVDKTVYASRNVYLYLSNSFETKKLLIPFNIDKWMSLHRFVNFNSEDQMFYGMIAVLLLLLTGLFNMRTLIAEWKALRRKFFYYKRTDKLIMRENAIDKQELEEELVGKRLLHEVYF